MNSARVKKIITLFLIAVLAVGCSSSQQSRNETDDIQRDSALDHFLQGSVLDQKGEYANAILEYQDALQYIKEAAIYHAIAKDYSILGKHDLAMQAGREAVRIQPDSRDYRQTLAEIYLNAFAFEDAAKEYEEMIHIDPQYREAWLTLARLQQLRNSEKAIATYQEIVSRFGPVEDVYLQMAQLYSAQGKFQEAVEALLGMLEVDPGNFEITKGLGDLYVRQDSIEKALALYTGLAERRPEDVELRAAIAHAYLVKQDYGNASQQFEQIMKKDTLSVDGQIRFGQVFISFIEKDSAVIPYVLQLFEKIKINYPSDWRPYWFLGAVNNIIKRDSLALINYHRVIDLAKSNPDGWIGAASVHYDNNRFEEAINLLTEAKQFTAEEFRIYFLLGISCQRVHRAIEAASALEKAIQLNEKSVEAFSALGMVYDEMKRFEDSDSMYEHALRLDPKNHLILNNYGYSLAERGIQLERALKMSKEAVAQQPENQSYLDTCGWIFFQLGDFQEAEQWIRKAVELGSKSTVIYEHLGDVYLKLSDIPKAMEFWQKALEYDPNNEEVKEKIQRGGM